MLRAGNVLDVPWVAFIDGFENQLCYVHVCNFEYVLIEASLICIGSLEEAQATEQQQSEPQSEQQTEQSSDQQAERPSSEQQQAEQPSEQQQG